MTISQNVEDHSFVFKCFIHEASAQNAADQYAAGTLAYYKDLERHAQQMVQPLDNYSFRRKFILGLPEQIITAIYTACGITAKHSTIEEILEEVRLAEAAVKAIAQITRKNQSGSGRKPFHSKADSH